MTDLTDIQKEEMVLRARYHQFEGLECRLSFDEFLVNEIMVLRHNHDFMLEHWREALGKAQMRVINLETLLRRIVVGKDNGIDEAWGKTWEGSVLIELSYEVLAGHDHKFVSDELSKVLWKILDASNIKQVDTETPYDTLSRIGSTAKTWLREYGYASEKGED